MEEPKKVLRAQYLGSMQVSQASGMDVLNDAIDHMVTNTPNDQWRNVNVAVAPSMISILTPNASIRMNSNRRMNNDRMFFFENRTTNSSRNVEFVSFHFWELVATLNSVPSSCIQPRTYSSHMYSIANRVAARCAKLSKLLAR